MAYLVEIAAMSLNPLCFLCSPKHKILWAERSDLTTKYRSLYNGLQLVPKTLDLPAFAEKRRVNMTDVLANDCAKRNLPVKGRLPHYFSR